MSFPIADNDADYLLKMIKEGNAMPVLGAGASVSSTTAHGKPIPMSGGLAFALCEAAALPYEGENIKDVIDAIKGDNLLSSSQVLSVYMESYKGCRPSNEMERLLSYTWRRIYLWNIDDILENIKGRRAQVLRLYNGMIDKAVEVEGHEYLHAVYLHGQITKPEHGFIFTEEEYNNAINSSWHYWYKRLAQDYFSYCPVIIGSSLNEPILSSEVDRAKREDGSRSGRAFLITPDDFTSIKVRALRSRGVIHVKATLEDFVNWLQKKIPNGTTPTDVLRSVNSYSDDEISRINRFDIKVAHSLFPINPEEIRLRARQLSEADYSASARSYLNGFPPSWITVAAEIPVELSATRALHDAIGEFLQSDRLLFIVTGQSGGGKSTAIMQSLLKYGESEGSLPIFELSSDVSSFTNAMHLMERLHPDGVIIYIPDVFVYGDTFISDLDSIKGKNIFIVSAARSNEWHDRLSRYIGDIAERFVFERFIDEDMEPLIERILKYVPAPKFRRLKLDEQKRKIRSSRSQLLIALKEATESDNFSNVISHEYENLPDEDTKSLLVIVGLATLARVGMSPEIARETYSRLSTGRPYQRALDALAGIVEADMHGRLFARHELYIRHIIENIVTFDKFSDAIKNLFRYYVKYNIPIVRSVGRLDGLLFRFVLNHKFIADIEKRKHADGRGIEIYNSFEVDFQLDGHYWLQYGLYLANRGKVEDALRMLRRSIDAYPENSFAVHAYADIQLRYAASRPSYDTVTKDLIAGAVKTLQEMDASSNVDVDVYPIVTLTNGHISALLKHGEKEEAINVGRRYFDRLTQVDKIVSSATLRNARERVIRFVTLGDWQERYMAAPAKGGARRGRRKPRGRGK